MSYYGRRQGYGVEEFLQLQSEHKCGMRQNNGRRCTNPWVESVPIDPDRPYGDIIGACGMHLKDMMADLERVQRNRWQKSLTRYVEFENKRLMRAFQKVGIKVKIGGYGQQEFVLENPGDLIEKLQALGAITEIDLRGECREGEHIKPCGPSEHETFCECGCELSHSIYRDHDEALKNCWDPPPEVKHDGEGKELGAEGLRSV